MKEWFMILLELFIVVFFGTLICVSAFRMAMMVVDNLMGVMG